MTKPIHGPRIHISRSSSRQAVIVYTWVNVRNASSTGKSRENRMTKTVERVQMNRGEMLLSGGCGRNRPHSGCK